MSFTNGVQSYSNRQTDAAGITVVSNAAGDITSLLGKTLAYDTAGRLSQATGVPPCPGGVNCSGLQTTTSRYNGWGQRFLRENDREQSVFSYGLEGFTLLSQTTRRLATSQQSTTEHIWLPTASGPMPVAAVIDGVHYAVHADHLNTPRRLSDSAGQTRWQWPYSGFGEIAPQATPAAGQAPVSFALRYPGQIDDGNELFYNWHRFYEPRVGRYTKADPIGLDGGWNRFGYVGGNPLGFTDPMGLNSIGDWTPPPRPPLVPMHPDSSLSKSSINYWSCKPTSEIINSLRPGLPESLKADPKTGLIWNGNTRVSVLQGRGVDVNSLPRESYSPRGGVGIRGVGILGAASLAIEIIEIIKNEQQCKKSPCSCDERCM